MARPKQALLTRQRIVDAASLLVDAEGLDALSMRRLATELGVQGPSLYNHFATKAEILDAVADAVTEQVDVSAFGQQDWAEALRRWAKSYHAVLGAHPNVVPVLAHGPGRRPGGLAIDIDPALYERYPHLHSASRLAAHHVAVDEGAFELGLDLLITGLLSMKGLVDDVRA
jgi:AcrR family transcriptional regulator